ncbi:MAG TPA: hypothetical protein DEB30_01875 [Candidatus Peribacter riflensis]|nr:hypothetical protein [Candidatus Peribacter riflensis]
MTKPRPSPHRELYGIIGHVPDASRILKQWNAAFRERGIDASLDVYPTTEKNLPERLSEMFHFDRRGYLVGNDLSKVIIPLLDRVEPAARRRPSSAKASEGKKGFVIEQKWPAFDAALTKASTHIIAVQVNGKLRGEIEVDAATPKEEVLQKAKAHANVQKFLTGKVKKEIYVAGKLVSLVV